MKRILTGTTGFMLSAGVVALAGTGVASAQTTSNSTACQQIQGTLSSIQSTLPQAASNPKMLSSKIGAYASQLKKASATGSPALQKAVNSFVADLQAAGSGKVNVSKLTSDAGAITAACKASAPSQAKAPSGAPSTGGGSTSGVQDPALIGLGGASRRNRFRSAHRD
jgi:hypothetical protein